MEKQFRMFAVDLMQGKDITSEQREYARGFFAGMKYLLDKPKFTQAEIARELEKRKDVEASD